jgi:hypothetical protein
MIWQAIGEVSRDPSSQHERPIDRVRDSEQYFSSRQIEGSISILNFFPPNRGFDFYLSSCIDDRWPTTMAVPMPIGQQLPTTTTTRIFPCTYLFPDCQPHPKSV